MLKKDKLSEVNEARAHVFNALYTAISSDRNPGTEAPDVSRESVTQSPNPVSETKPRGHRRKSVEQSRKQPNATTGTRQTYILTATPTFADTECTTFTYTEASAKGVTGTGSVASCWVR